MEPSRIDDFIGVYPSSWLYPHWKRQRVETFIDEEALLLAKYIREENKILVPRIAELIWFAYIFLFLSKYARIVTVRRDLEYYGKNRG